MEIGYHALLPKKPPEIAEMYNARNPILECSDDLLPFSVPIVKSYPLVDLGGVINDLGCPLEWCIHDHPNPSGRPGNPRLLIAVVKSQIIPRGQLKVEDIRYAFGGAMNYQEIVDAYNLN